jgi:predicted N-acyltransferase
MEAVWRQQSLIIDTLADIDPAQWQALAGDNPTLSYTFLHALHETAARRRAPAGRRAT